jgi:REP element-mobilizing transposase RayT
MVPKARNRAAIPRVVRTIIRYYPNYKIRHRKDSLTVSFCTLLRFPVFFPMGGTVRRSCGTEFAETDAELGDRTGSLPDALLNANQKARTEPKNYFILRFLARVRVVGRLARVIAVGVAHHVTQRGNGRRFLLESDADRRVYLDLLRENLAFHEVLLVGYCLMSNHVHLIVIPADPEGLALSMKHTHGRYASYWNVVHNSIGHAWQGGYFSCPLDEPHLWEALR